MLAAWKTHSTRQVHSGLLVCFDLPRDVLHPLRVDKGAVHFTKRKGHLAKPHFEQLLSGCDMGVSVCMLVVGNSLDSHVKLDEIHNEGNHTTQRYFKMPGTQKHLSTPLTSGPLGSRATLRKAALLMNVSWAHSLWCSCV